MKHLLLVPSISCSTTVQPCPSRALRLVKVIMRHLNYNKYLHLFSSLLLTIPLELNCSYIMTSFHEEKGLNFIKSKPKDFVRYNLKQNSRVYPAGGRIASSNYMPQVRERERERERERTLHFYILSLIFSVYILHVPTVCLQLLFFSFFIPFSLSVWLDFLECWLSNGSA